MEGRWKVCGTHRCCPTEGTRILPGPSPARNHGVTNLLIDGMNIHGATTHPSTDTFGLRRLLEWGGAAIVLITAQTLLLHGIGGRQTPIFMALSWSSATVIAWLLTLIVSWPLVTRWFALVRRHPLSGMALLAVAIVGAIALAAALRAILDLGLPALARSTWVVERTLTVRMQDYALRWLGPGVLFCGLVLALRWRSATTVPAPVALQSPSVAPTPAPPVAAAQLSVRVGEREIIVPEDHISWCEADGNYVHLHLRQTCGGQRVLTARLPIGQLARTLPAHRFVRVHRSIIVAVSDVAELRAPRDRGASLLLRSGATVPVSREGRRLLKEQMGPAI